MDTESFPSIELETILDNTDNGHSDSTLNIEDMETIFIKSISATTVPNSLVTYSEIGSLWKYRISK